ncbi:hypothetical protein TRVL_06420 [Trypanosoma vivax]|uniref:Dynein regulatory complex protein 10 n=1 Tax=Trypanosoma vivax (strain Y486) TaxID=1055687 RepID=G0U193_TRYVY|nr:hypothetical protein TRVL_06420 [Trypanosoma vivax]CCC49848.1 conserved hypothetical protein [Trypanosoma vivax Y486]
MCLADCSFLPFLKGPLFQLLFALFSSLGLLPLPATPTHCLEKSVKSLEEGSSAPREKLSALPFRALAFPAMDMDALTRRQANRAEYVLRDLVRDLQLISLLPTNLMPWCRRDCLEGVRDNANMPVQRRVFNASCTSSLDDEEGLAIAQLIYGIAERYGDPTDIDRNELLLQMTEFAELEKSMIESATIVGTVEEYEIQQHHRLFRAVLDTLHDEGYTEVAFNIINEGRPAPASGPQPQERDADTDDDDDGKSSGSSICVMPPSILSRFLDQGVPSFQRTVESLMALVVARNTTTVSEDIHNYKILHEAVNKEKSTSADVKALKREYQETKEARRTEVEALQAEVRQLEEEIEYNRSVVAMEMAAFLEVNARMEEERRSVGANRVEVLTEQAHQLQQSLKTLISSNQAEAAALRTQRAKKEAAVSAAISEYDTQMATLHAASSALNKETEEDTEAIVVLESELDVLRTERSEYELDKYIESMRQKHSDDMQSAMNACASTVQMCFRAYLTRVNVEKMMSSMKKKRRKTKS